MQMPVSAWVALGFGLALLVRLFQTGGAGAASAAVAAAAPVAEPVAEALRLQHGSQEQMSEILGMARGRRT